MNFFDYLNGLLIIENLSQGLNREGPYDLM